MENKPLVSVIIACKNTASYFEQCLQSVRSQTYKNIELIVIDNFSTDGTYEIGKKYADKCFQKGPERSTQFNFGFGISNGDLIYRIVLESDLIEKCVSKISAGYDALALHNRSVGDSIWAKVRYLERESYRNDNNIVAVRFMKRTVFKDLGMFDESLVAGEDFDLHNRMVSAGYRWTHVDAVENHIGEPKYLYEVWNKFYYYGRTISRYRQKIKLLQKNNLSFFDPLLENYIKNLFVPQGYYLLFIPI
jgi:glycosyltransferase involved in cell wall biosynthesis